MNRPLHILLMLLLLATTAGRGMAASAMIDCTQMPMTSHDGGLMTASAHAAMAASCDSSSASMDHDLGLCCLACVALPLASSLMEPGAAPVHAAPLLGDPERYRSIVPDPLRRPPRSLA
ncbi:MULTISPECIES: hypothetical protein [Pseudomonas]|uniref:DUF2946 domain-containing protein n=1 Tax=Pseudomonas kuykendallii TaxID=1007099 RepID=A0A1H2S0Z4_9PSED|nr:MULTISPECIES: hypothetical protein [Pseudomonas]MCQ4270388.1 hypothetical protein [Pseudomonas kuykendallii]SDW25283.1 hypothetical protein SAMN05216287_0512 [Pseudomonas kuykendallii]